MTDRPTTREVAAAATDFRDRPIAAVAAVALLLPTIPFFALLLPAAELGTLLFPIAVIGVAALGQVSRLVTAPAERAVHELLAGTEARSAFATARSSSASRFGAALRERALVLLGTPLAFALLAPVCLAALTIGGAILSLAGIRSPQGPMAVFRAGILAVPVIGAAIGAPLRLASERTATTQNGQSAATALSIVREYPAVNLLLVALRVGPWGLLLAGYGVSLLRSTPASLSRGLLVLAVGAALVGWPLAVAIERRVTVTRLGDDEHTAAEPTNRDRSARPDDGGVSEPPSSPFAFRRACGPDARIIVVLLLLVGILGTSAAAVRVADERPATAKTTDVEAADADRIVAVANRIGSRQRHYVNESVEIYNGTTGDWEEGLAYDAGIDVADRQYLLDPEEPSNAAGIGPLYWSDGTVAFGYEVPPTSVFGVRLSYRSGGWTVVPIPGRTFDGAVEAPVTSQLRGPARERFARRASVLSRSNGTVTVGVTGARSVRRLYDFGEDWSVGEDSYVRLTVDAETGRPLRLLVHRNVTSPDGTLRRVRVTVRYTQWGTYDLRRPSEIREPTPLEVFWDVLGY